MTDREDFAILCSIDGSAFRFDSGWQQDPIDSELLTLEEAIKQASDWVKYKPENKAAIFHKPTGCVINLYDLDGDFEEKLSLAKTLINGFYEMTEVRAYYLAKNAGWPVEKELEFWNQAKQKLDKNHPLRRNIKNEKQAVFQRRP